MKNYEVALIIKPSLTDSELKSFILNLEKFIQNDSKGKILEKEDWGRRKFSYRIKKEDMGYYYFLNFSLEAEALAKFDKKLRLDNNILRYIISNISTKI